MLACQQGEISLVRELLEAGIDCNATDNVSVGVLNWFVCFGALNDMDFANKNDSLLKNVTVLMHCWLEVQFETYLNVPVIKGCRSFFKLYDLRLFITKTRTCS